MRRSMQYRHEFGVQRRRGEIPPVAVGAVAGLVGGIAVGAITHYAAKLAARYAGPLALANAVLVGGTVGYLSGSYYAERHSG